MSRRLRTPIQRWNIFWLAIGLGGCAIADSTIVDLRIPYAPGTVACSSSLGSYSLPKSYVHVIVGRAANGPPDIVVPASLGNNQFKFDIVRRADPALTMCLDYLASIFANDEITVIKQDESLTASVPNDPGTAPLISRQFLRRVIVNAADRSVQIARNLIQAAFVGASGNPGFGPERSFIIDNGTFETLADLEFDPFDTRDSAEANARLAPLGICLVLEGFTFDRGSLSVDDYCNSPVRARRHPPAVAELYAVKSREPVPPNTPGILYRPRQTYMISVYRKVDPKGHGKWNLSHRADTDLENLSPVIAVGIPRALFARRNAILGFEEGALVQVCVAKSSELENFVAIPFEVARALVALPSQLMQVRINTTTQQSELARVQEIFIRTQAALVQTQIQQKAQTSVPSGTALKTKKIEFDPLLKKEVKSLAAGANDFSIAATDTTLKAQMQALCGEALEIFTNAAADLPLAQTLPAPPGN
jgi:hypothetical protein